MGYTALLIFAGLQAIPGHLYEVAKLDGASAFQTFRKITIPLLRPVLVLVLVVTVIGSFQVFDTVAVTTQGGPVNATRVIQYYIYQRAFTESDFGYGSAIVRHSLPHSRPRGLHPDEVPQGQRVGPGLRSPA